MKPLNILLIEDNEGDQIFIEEILNKTPNFTFKGVRTLQAGIEALGNANYDVILLDLFLPDVQGDALKAFFELKNYCDSQDKKEIAIVILTGLSDDDISLWAIRSGAQDFFNKAGLDLYNKGLINAITRAYERALHIQDELQKVHPSPSPLPAPASASSSLNDSFTALNEFKRRLGEGNGME
jgi:PleD family two-component response regulator